MLRGRLLSYNKNEGQDRTRKEHSTKTLSLQQLGGVSQRDHTGRHSDPQQLCRNSTFHKAHRQITGSPGEAAMMVLFNSPANATMLVWGQLACCVDKHGSFPHFSMSLFKCTGREGLPGAMGCPWWGLKIEVLECKSNLKITMVQIWPILNKLKWSYKNELKTVFRIQSQSISNKWGCWYIFSLLSRIKLMFLNNELLLVV